MEKTKRRRLVENIQNVKFRQTIIYWWDDQEQLIFRQKNSKLFNQKKIYIWQSEINSKGSNLRWFYKEKITLNNAREEWIAIWILIWEWEFEKSDLNRCQRWHLTVQFSSQLWLSDNRPYAMVLFQSQIRERRK